jgi:hypothetical protein
VLQRKQERKSISAQDSSLTQILVRRDQMHEFKLGAFRVRRPAPWSNGGREPELLKEQRSLGQTVNGGRHEQAYQCEMHGVEMNLPDESNSHFRWFTPKRIASIVLLGEMPGVGSRSLMRAIWG